MVFAAAGGSPKVLRMDDGPELVSQALQRFCEARSISAIGMEYVCESLEYVRSHKEFLPSRLLYVAIERFGLEHTSE
jgi:putative transposase